MSVWYNVITDELKLFPYSIIVIESGYGLFNVWDYVGEFE